MKAIRDHITKLCEHLIDARDLEEVYPASEQLQEAIHQRVERVRQDAMGVVMIDRVVDLDGVIKSQLQDFSEPSRQHLG